MSLDVLNDLPGAVRDRLRRRGAEERLAHIERVVTVIEEIVAKWGWDAVSAGRATRAGWYHDALKADHQESWVDRIAAAGQEPDPWIVDHAPGVLHAHAGAAWAETRWEEKDRGVLDAVRYHPTGHPEWCSIGWLLYVADFCEPGRAFATKVASQELLGAVRSDPGALPRVALQVLDQRLEWIARSGKNPHPLSDQALARLEWLVG